MPQKTIGTISFDLRVSWKFEMFCKFRNKIWVWPLQQLEQLIYVIQKSIEFFSLTILKRLDSDASNRYNKVCLVLDEDLDNKICTNTDSGFDNQHDNLITWSLDSKGPYFHNSGWGSWAGSLKFSLIFHKRWKCKTDNNKNSKFQVASKIDLHFQDTEHAQIAELHIQFKRKLLNWYGQFFAYKDQFLVIFKSKNCHEMNLQKSADNISQITVQLIDI